MTETTVTKNKQGYGYKYTDLAQIHEYLEQNNMKYYQFIKRIDTEDYVFTRRYIDGRWEDEPIQGCRVVNATLSGKSNPAQEQGSALTYARRYSLLMAFGLATDDDDAESLTRKKTEEKEDNKPINEANLRVLQSLIKDLPNAKDFYNAVVAVYQISDLKELTKKQYGEILLQIKKQKGE
jgi:hypothetical protein